MMPLVVAPAGEERLIKRIGDGVPYAEIEAVRSVAANSDASNAHIAIRVESTHGFKIAISSYDQRKQQSANSDSDIII